MAGLLVELFILSISASIVMRILHQTTKETLHTINQQKLENNISKSLATLYAMTNRSPEIFGLPFYLWRDMHETQPEYLKETLDKLSATNKIKDDTVFLETLDVLPLLFTRKTYQNEIKYTGNIPSKHRSLPGRDRWALLSQNGIYKLTKKITTKHNPILDVWEFSTDDLDSSTQILFSHGYKKNSDNLDNHRILAPIQDHILIYVNNQNELRRFSLITLDNQPIANDIDFIKRESTNCKIRGKIKNITNTSSFPCSNKIFEPMLFYDLLDH